MTAPFSPFAPAPARRLDPAKFADPKVTATGEPRAHVPISRLETLWFNTGTLCNIACRNCYIESSPENDSLAYLTADDVTARLDEILRLDLPVREIGFTGGEPFMNRDILAMIGASLDRGFRTLVLTNAMRPMRRFDSRLPALAEAGRGKLTLRVSLDHYTRSAHDAERGEGGFEASLEGLMFLAGLGVDVAVAGRRLPGENEAAARAGFACLFTARGLPIDAADPARLVLFPEMDLRADTPEITEACWTILGKSRDSVMCATSRMVVRRPGEAGSRIVACTLTPHAPGFDLGPDLAKALAPVSLNHPHCSKFCVLGGASCSPV